MLDGRQKHIYNLIKKSGKRGVSNARLRTLTQYVDVKEIVAFLIKEGITIERIYKKTIITSKMCCKLAPVTYKKIEWNNENNTAVVYL